MLLDFFKKYTSPFKLSRIGIMGMNMRNCRYISPYNPRELYPLVDNKVLTKKIAQKAGVTVPKLIGTIGHQYEVSNILDMVKARKEFCIKPAQGSGGKGILVIVDHQGDKFIKPNKQELEILDIERHISNILAGLFSLGGKLDTALIEELIHFDNVFDGYSYEGVPDSRVIVFKGFPVMAMMRLSTAESDGKANLHQGAVGVGLWLFCIFSCFIADALICALNSTFLFHAPRAESRTLPPLLNREESARTALPVKTFRSSFIHALPPRLLALLQTPRAPSAPTYCFLL